MVEVSLKRVLKKAGTAIDYLLNALSSPVQVQDAAGKILKGAASLDPADEHPITLGAETLGWVVGDGQAAIVAKLLTHLAERELEMKTLAHEALDKYREINLLYNLSEKLNASLDVAVVAQMVLGEARKLIPATSASIVLLNPAGALKTGLIFSDAGWNDDSDFILEDLTKTQQGIAGTVARTGKGEIVNQVAADPRYKPRSQPLSSLICVPLKTERGVIGVVSVSSQEPAHYTAQHLKLLTTVASQAVQAIENARLHQQQLREAKAREERLKQQLQDLRLEVDAAKRTKQVAEITETEYFQQLQQRAGQLRQRRTEV
jgi:K+-sensing histidine kinase KdpD